MSNDAKLPDGAVERSTRAKLPDAAVEGFSRAKLPDSAVEWKKHNIIKDYKLFYFSVFLLFLIEIGSNFSNTSTELYRNTIHPLLSSIEVLLLLINVVHYICNTIIMKIIIGILIGIYLFQIISIIFSVGVVGYEIGANAIVFGSFVSLGLLAWMEMKL